MSYPHNLRAPVNPFAPEPTGVCDRCDFLYPLDRLEWQMEYRGRSLQRIGVRVCPRCLDEPNPQLQPVIISGTEGVVRDPRPPQYALDATGGQTLPTDPSFPMQFALEGDDQQTFLGDEDAGFELADEDTGASIIPEVETQPTTPVLGDEGNQADLSDEDTGADLTPEP